MFIHKFTDKKERASKKTRYSFYTRGLEACMPASSKSDIRIRTVLICPNPNNITITNKRSSLKHTKDFNTLSPSSILEGQLSP